MLDLISSPNSLAVLVSGIIFTVFGLSVGFVWGYKWYARFLINTLAREGYLKYRSFENGDIELFKLDEKQK